MKFRQFTVVCLASLSFTGCATITSDKMQTVSVNTKTTNGQAVEKTSCTLKNDKGVWQMESPGFVVVHRSAEDLMVECKKDGVADGFLRAISRAAGGMWGNIVFGGGVGAIIDHTNGSGYNYPDELPVKMGTSTTVDRSQNAPQQPATSATTQETSIAQKN